MGIPLLYQSPAFLCLKKDENDISYTYICDEYEACHNAVAFTVVEKNIATEFNLICDRKYKLAFCGSLFFIGN